MERKAYVHHTAIFVRDMAWHIDFFGQVFGMAVRKVSPPEEKLRQIWLHGGIQLIEDAAFCAGEGRFAHFGIFVGDLNAVLERAARYPVKELPEGRNWLELPEGIVLELLIDEQ